VNTQSTRPTQDQIARYENGSLTAQGLATELGVSAPTAAKRLRGAGVTVRGKGRPAVPLAESDLRGWVAEGLTTREMSQRSVASEETIRRAMVRLGLDRLPAKARPERNGFWSGGLSVDKSGYILALAPGHPRRTIHNTVRLHRLVMERSLGRFLETGEVVDHCDGDTSDNRIRNLVLYPSNAEHLRATLTGRHAIADRLTKTERERQRQAAVQRARDLVSTIHQERGSGARLSLSELDQWIDELATCAPHP
jgi:hypothetical protein